MTTETLEWLQQNTRIGFTEKRGPAWHAARGADGEYLNHFPGPVPLEEARKVFGYELAEGEPSSTVHTRTGETIYVADDHRKSIIRVDTGQTFGYFTRDGYQIHDPETWLVDTVGMILDTSVADLGIASLGILKGGAQAFVQFELPETFTTTTGGVQHRPYIGAATSHDGTLSTTYLTGTTVMQCDNSVSAALTEAGAGKVKVRHSAKSLTRLAEVRENLGVVIEMVGDQFDREVSQLLDEAVPEDKWKAFVEAYVNPSGKELQPGRSATLADNKRIALNRLWNYDDRVAPWRGTAWGVVSAVNTYNHHEANVKNVSRVERNMSRTIFGEWDKLDQQTLRVLAKV
jgi:phage/plasmid-like protein (TIGR03299 family)